MTEDKEVEELAILMNKFMVEEKRGCNPPEMLWPTDHRNFREYKHMALWIINNGYSKQGKLAPMDRSIFGKMLTYLINNIDTDWGNVGEATNKTLDKYCAKFSNPKRPDSGMMALDEEALAKYLEISDWEECTSKKMANEICLRFGTPAMPIPSGHQPPMPTVQDIVDVMNEVDRKEPKGLKLIIEYAQAIHDRLVKGKT